MGLIRAGRPPEFGPGWLYIQVLHPHPRIPRSLLRGGAGQQRYVYNNVPLRPFRVVELEQMTDRIHNGRKEIGAFLRPYLNLVADFRTAWNKVVRWRVLYGLDRVIVTLPNGRIQLSEAEFQVWYEGYKARWREEKIPPG
jgi:hypothetical protein